MTNIFRRKQNNTLWTSLCIEHLGKWRPFANLNWHNTKARLKLKNLYGPSSPLCLCSVPGSWPQFPGRGGAPCPHSCCPEQAHRSHLPSGAERGRHWPAVRAVSELWSSASDLSKLYWKKSHMTHLSSINMLLSRTVSTLPLPIASFEDFS